MPKKPMQWVSVVRFLYFDDEHISRVRTSKRVPSVQAEMYADCIWIVLLICLTCLNSLNINLQECVFYMTMTSLFLTWDRQSHCSSIGFHRHSVRSKPSKNWFLPSCLHFWCIWFQFPRSYAFEEAKEESRGGERRLRYVKFFWYLFCVMMVSDPFL